MPATKKSKKTAKKPTTFLCCECMKTKPIADMTRNENGSPRCGLCLPAGGPAPTGPRFRWYVLECIPGKETRTKADAWKQLRIWNLDDRVKQILIPTKLEERVRPKTGDVIESGVEASKGDAIRRGRERARFHCGRGEDDAGPDGADATPGVRDRYYPEEEKVERNGKTVRKSTGRWKWEVVQVLKEQTREMVRVSKYPGYILFHMDFCDDIEKLVRAKCRTAGRFLLQPVVYGYRLETSKSERGGWNWRVRHPDTDEIVAKGRCPGQREKAIDAGNAVKQKLEAFHPTALADQESAEVLLREKAVTQLCTVDKVERDRAVLSFKVGDRVRGESGVWKGVEGTVQSIDKKDPTAPVVIVNMTVLGNPVPVRVEWFELKFVSRGAK